MLKALLYLLPSWPAARFVLSLSNLKPCESRIKRNRRAEIGAAKVKISIIVGILIILWQLLSGGWQRRKESPLA